MPDTNKNKILKSNISPLGFAYIVSIFLSNDNRDCRRDRH